MGMENGVVVVAREPEHFAACMLALSKHLVESTMVVVMVVGEQRELLANLAAMANLPSGVQRIVAYANQGESEPEQEATLRAVEMLLDGGAERIAVLHDDVGLREGAWFEMASALEGKAVLSAGQSFAASQYGRIAFVGPVSDGIAKPAQRVELGEAEVQIGADGYAAHRMRHAKHLLTAVDELDPCFVMMSREGAKWAAKHHIRIGLAMRRAATEGMRSAVAEGVYVTRMKPERAGAWEAGDGEALLDEYVLTEEYRKARSESEQSLALAMVAEVKTLRELTLLKAAIASAASLVDAVALVVTNNPLDLMDDKEFQEARKGGKLDRLDDTLLRNCGGRDASGVGAAVSNWLVDVVKQANGKAGTVRARISTSRDDLDARSLAYRLCGEAGATWLLLLEQDELLDGSVDASCVKRLMRHPDESVLGYDCGILTHYNSPAQVRVDGPRGSGTTSGPSGVRLVRWVSPIATTPVRSMNGAVSIAPLISQESVRAANIRIRKLDQMRESDRGPEQTDSVSVRPYRNDTRIGFHCLIYERENIHDVARWLDLATGICDHSVLVWTSEEAVPSSWSSLAARYNAQVVHHPLRDDLATARNAGIDALHERGTLTWAWFVDPDEWLANPLDDAKAFRHMAESSRYGFLFQTCNYRRGEAPSVSDSVRMSRLDAEGLIRMDGRVHEGFSDAWKKLQARNLHPRLVYAPFVVQHRGMSFSPERMRQKLDKYEHLLRLELADRPDSPGAWVSLGWHYFNDGFPEEGVECFRRGVECAGQSYLPYRELAYWHLRQAQGLVGESLERLVPSHQWYKTGKDLAAVLNEHVQPMREIAREPGRTIAPLPEFKRG